MFCFTLGVAVFKLYKAIYSQASSFVYLLIKRGFLNFVLLEMPNSNVNLQSNATIINIHSPNGSPEMNQPSIQPHQAPLKQSPKVEEYRKMIQHIMGKIFKRKRPPTSLLYLPSQSADQFENEDTIDLLIKLRSALMVCHSVGLSSQVLTQG